MEPQPLIIEQERIDDVPLLLGMMRRLQIAETLDQHLGQHHLHQGLSNGNLALGWIAYILSESDHRRVYAESSERRLSRCRRKSSSQAARRNLPLTLPLLASWRNSEAATRRSIPRFSAAFRSCTRQSSSRKMTSSTQCRPFCCW